ncbi:hypothetical protein [Gimesia aquarii]|uniref:Uncharacterized protein n=1 Tax=Gimesia aquarii TaxID=2527964 RepID=A0A517W498_9PLAN|nr:hypothetical protein [Gimesia aquarii]QDU00076.1 hypothetical protein V144x_55890 [Gimesia aquarii]
MHRHPCLVCYLILFVLIGNQLLHADEPSPPEQRAKTTSGIPDGHLTDNDISLNSQRIAPEKILTQWSVASQLLSTVAPSSKIDELKKENQAYFSGHELTLISEFQKPVSTRTLLADYGWQVVKQTTKYIILRGQPKDTLTRRLCRPFELQINSQTMLPESLKFLALASKPSIGFASIELTAYKSTQTTEPVISKSTPQIILRKVAKAVFPEAENNQNSTSTTGSIKRISFATSHSENQDQAEIIEIEKMVLRWIAETQRIESIELGNGVTISKLGNQRDRAVPKNLNSKPNGAFVTGNSAFQNSLQPWLIDVEKNAFIIESFATERSTNENGSSAPRFITLNMKPNPAFPPNSHPGTKWDAVEIVFSSDQPLPIKISKTRLHIVQQFLLSDLKIQYAE